jgi:hypothetical protein
MLAQDLRQKSVISSKASATRQLLPKAEPSSTGDAKEKLAIIW